MRYYWEKIGRLKGLTLLEMVIAMAIISAVFASILPLFRNVQAGWDARQGASEAVQNGRAAMEHLKRYLSSATNITAVSSSSDTNGYIEFTDNTGTTLRCDLAASNYIQFGPTGSQAELAGPVTSMKFTCYSLDDLNSPTSDVDLIRLVKIEAEFVNSAPGATDKSFTTSAYLQTSGTVPGAILYTPFEFETAISKDPDLAQIDTSHYLCVYEGNNDDGWATVLTVDTGTWEISRESLFEFDPKKGRTPKLAKIDSTHYLCAYQGNNDNGWVTVLTVNTDTWEITSETPFEFDNKKDSTLSLAQIDSTHYLCAYEGNFDDGWVTVLTVDTGTWEITKESSFEFDNINGKTPSLAQIDSTHYLCAYEGALANGWATVLTVDTGTWGITKETPFEFDSAEGKTPELKRLDSTHYLCAYSGSDENGRSTVLTVDTDNWTISSGVSNEFNDQAGKMPRLSQKDSNSFLCVYERDDGIGTYDGWLNTLTVDPVTWSVSSDTPFEYVADIAEDPDVIKITEGYYLSVYSGVGDNGWAVVIEPDSDSAIMP